MGWAISRLLRYLSRFLAKKEENTSILCLVAEASASIVAEHWLVCSRCSWRVHLSLHNGNRGGGSDWHNPSIFRTDILSSQHRHCLRLQVYGSSQSVTCSGSSAWTQRLLPKDCTK